MAESPTFGSFARERALYWVARTHSGELTEDERHALAAWLARSEENRREYEHAQRTWDGIDPFRTAISAEMEAARAYPRRRRTPRFSPAVAALVLLVLGAGIWLSLNHVESELYRTAKGEQKAFTLADGSAIVLNTDTELRVAYSRKARGLRLTRGEALFTVAAGDERPFEVVAGGGLVRDIGTSFSVHVDGARTAVVVVEGVVIVTPNRSDIPYRLTAGQHLSYSALGQVSRIERVDAAALTAWQQGYLVLDGMSLERLCQEITRYHDVHMEFHDPALKTLEISGTFNVRNIDSLLTAIEAMFPIEAVVDARQIVLRARPAAAG